MNNKSNCKKTKVKCSKVTKLSLRRTDETLNDSDFFGDFGSFSASLKSFKSSGESLSLTTLQKSSSLKENSGLNINVGDLDNSVVAGNLQNSFLDSTLTPKAEQLKVLRPDTYRKDFETSRGNIRNSVVCDSDDSFVENFRTPNKIKFSNDEEHLNRVASPTVDKRNLPNKFLHKSNIDTGLSVGDFSVIHTLSRSIHSHNESKNHTSDNCESVLGYTRVNCDKDLKSNTSDTHLEKLLGIEEISAKDECEYSEKFRSNDDRTSVAQEKCVKLEDIKKPQQEDSEVPLNPEIDDCSPYFETNNTNNLLCPLCWKKFDKRTTHLSHMKSCAIIHKVTTKQLLDALHLQNKQTAERKALGLPVSPVTAVSIPTRKSSSKKIVGVSKDPNLQLALALSASMREAEELKIQEEEEVLIEAGLGEEVMERQKTLLEKYGFTSSKSPIQDSVYSRLYSGTGIKKFKGSTPTLLVRSREERERLITEKVAIILMGDDDCTSDSKASDIYCHRHDFIDIRSKQLLKWADQKCNLWTKAQTSPEADDRNSYYIGSLGAFIIPSVIETGSKLRDISEIPCREKTPERLNLCSNEENQVLKEQDDDSKEQGWETTTKNNPSNTQVLTFLEDNQNLADCDPASLCKNTVLKNWESLINNSFMSDVTIRVSGGMEIPGHKLVFFAQCPEIFHDICAAGQENNRDYLKWDSFSSTSVLAFLYYLYCGNVDRISTLNEEFQDIHSLAVKYNISELLSYLHSLPYLGSNTTGGKISFAVESLSYHSSEEGAIKKKSLQTFISEIDTCSPKSNAYEVEKNGLEADTQPEVCVSTVSDDDDFMVDRCNINGKVSPDLFSDCNVSTTVISTQSDLDILSSMLNKTTPIDNTLGSLQMAETKGDSQVMHYIETSEMEKNITLNPSVQNMKKDCHNVLQHGSTSVKRKLPCDISSLCEPCLQPKKLCASKETNLLESRNKGIFTDTSCFKKSAIDTIDLTQNSGSSENDELCAVDLKFRVEEENACKLSQENKHAANNSLEYLQHNENLCENNSRTNSPMNNSGEIDTCRSTCDDNEENASNKNNLSGDIFPDYDFCSFDDYIPSPHSLRDCLSPNPTDTFNVTNVSASPKFENVNPDQNPLKSCQLSPRRRSLSQVNLRTNQEFSPFKFCSQDETSCKKMTDLDKPISSESFKCLLDDSFADQLGNSSFLKSDNIAIESTNKKCNTNVPSCSLDLERSRRLGTPHQQREFSENITPMQDYSAMKTPQLRKELQKYGLKPLKRKQAKLILRHIYNELHPLVPIHDNGPQAQDEVKTGESSSNFVRTSLICDKSAVGARSPVKRNILHSLSSSSEENFNALSDEDKGVGDLSVSSSQSEESDAAAMADDVIFCEPSNKEIPSSQEECEESDLRTAIDNYIKSNPEFYEKVLLYEPIWLQDLYDELKTSKLKFKLNDLMDYLDEQCITFRSAARPRHKRNRVKKKEKTNKPSQNVCKRKEDGGICGLSLPDS